MTLYETGLIGYAMTQDYRSQLHFSLYFPARLLGGESVWPYIRSGRLAHAAALLQWSLLFYRLFLVFWFPFPYPVLSHRLHLQGYHIMTHIIWYKEALSFIFNI